MLTLQLYESGACKMKYLIASLCLIMSFATIQNSSAKTREAGNKEQFMTYCTQKQSEKFCNCAANNKFDFFVNAEIDRRKKIYEQQTENLKRMLQISINNDPAMTEAKVKQFCPIIADYKKDVEAYAMKKFNSKKLLRHTTEVNAAVEEIRSKHASKLDTLHNQFGSNDITRRNVNQMKVSYCATQQHLLDAKESYERASDTNSKHSVEVPFNAVIMSAVKDHKGACKPLFKR